MMKFHILTLFPEMVQQGLATSILGRAAEKRPDLHRCGEYSGLHTGQAWKSR